MASTMMPFHLIHLEQWVSERLCISGGSLDLIALKDAMDHDNVMTEMSLTSLQRLLKESPHKMFRLDEDAKHDKCTVRYYRLLVSPFLFPFNWGKGGLDGKGVYV